MNGMHAFARLALRICPSEFRAQYGDQILSDIESDPAYAPRELLNVIGNGISMHIDGFVRDVAYAIRRLRSAPLFVAIVAITFALGIGANVGVFSVLNSVVLKPLPYLNPDGVVDIRASDTRRPSSHPAMSIDDIADLRVQTRALSGIAGVTADNATLVSNGRPVALGGMDVMPEYFSILGISTQLGRPLNANDSQPGVHSIVVSDSAWRKYLSADPAVIGKTIALDGVSYRIVGVTKPGQLFANPQGNELIPLDYIEALPEHTPANQRGSRYLGTIARVAPGQSIATVNADLRLAAKRLTALFPADDTGITYDARPLPVALLGEIGSMLWIVFASVIGILLIACANVANLLGARWSARDREFALRRALGASWRKIAAQLFVEISVLAALGGVVGVALAYGGVNMLRSSLLRDLPRGSGVSIDGTTLLYAVAVVIVTALVAGISPILMTRDRDLQLVLKTAGRGGGVSAGHRLRTGLVVAEVALALALVIVTGLMVRSFVSLTRTPLGIRPDGVLVTDIISLPERTYPTLTSRMTMQRDLLQRLRALPGVDSAALTVLYPLGDMSLNFDTAVFGETYANGAEPISGGNDVSPGYFRTMGISILRGRDFADSDSERALRVAIVNESFVRAFLHGREPIGTRIRVAGWNGTKAGWSTIVAVAGDERTKLSAPAWPMIYSPVLQAPPSYLAAVVHGSADRATLTREITAAFAASAPSIQPPDVYTMNDRVAMSTRQAQLTASLLGLLSIVALLLALAGIFGVMSFSVTQRTNEFGIRMAHGASTADIVADVLRRAAATAAAGIACGVVIAAIGANAISSQLHEVSPFDPLTFGVVVLLLFCCACGAALQPAIRATRVHPAVALRYE
jgi:putative ABC transport system permease protein